MGSWKPIKVKNKNTEGQPVWDTYIRYLRKHFYFIDRVTWMKQHISIQREALSMTPLPKLPYRGSCLHIVCVI